MGCSILGIDYHLPETVLTNDQLAREFPDWDVAKAGRKVGISRRHTAREGETALDLGERAAARVLGRTGADVDFILFCTETPDHFIPPNACLLQGRLGLGTSVGAYDYNLGCSGFVFGLAQAKGLIAAGLARRVLLVTADTYTRRINALDKGNRMIFGDGASACVIGETPDEGIGRFAFGTDGTRAMSLAIPNGGFRNPADPAAPLVGDDNGNARTANDLIMDGPGIFNFTLERVPELYAQVLEGNGLAEGDLDHVVFHQANQFMLQHLRMKMQIPQDKFVLDMDATGNTVSSSIPIVLKRLTERIEGPCRVLLAGFGVGLSWAGTVVKLGKQENP
ncbi:MAG: ketoacyl-ACP synthase III [Pseudodesulfovibrio sp.]